MIFEWLLIMTLATYNNPPILEVEHLLSKKDCELVKRTFLNMKKGKFDIRDAECVKISKNK